MEMSKYFYTTVYFTFFDVFNIKSSKFYLNRVYIFIFPPLPPPTGHPTISDGLKCLVTSTIERVAH